MTEIEVFRNQIEKHLSDTGMSPTQFGRTFANDPLFVFALRDGREPRTATRQKVIERIEQVLDA